MARGKAFISTSGWLYPHWRGTFYPKGLKQCDEFEYFSMFFNNVEINNSFYRLPPRQVFEQWAMNSRDDFMFVIKANRFITHMKKLKDPKEPIQRMLDACSGLGEKLGPILFQLPPMWPLNLERFEIFLSMLPKGYRYAFEFREPSWYDERVYKLLKQYGCAFCIYQLAGHTSPIITTADFVYVRLHGPTLNKYQGSYDFPTLRAWAELSRKWQKSGKDVYVYFDNDDSGYAAFNAQVLEMLLNKKTPISEQEAQAYHLLTDAIKKQQTISFTWQEHKITALPVAIGITKQGKGDLMLRCFSSSSSTRNHNTIHVNEVHDVTLEGIEITGIKPSKKSYDLIAINEDGLMKGTEDWRIAYKIVLPRARSRKSGPGCDDGAG